MLLWRSWRTFTNYLKRPQFSENHKPNSKISKLFLYDLFQAVLKWDDVQQTDLNVWLRLYGTEANPTNLVVTNLQWGKYADRPNMITCGEGITTTAATTTPPPPPLVVSFSQ